MALLRVQDERRLIVPGMAFLALAQVWPRFVPVGAGLGEDRVDLVRGFIFGLGIGLNLLAAYLGGRRRRRGGS